MFARQRAGQAGRSPLGRSDTLLVVVCLAQFMVVLDVSIVNVALASIQDSLDFSDAGLQWAVNAYTLTFAGFLMLGGRACDLLPRRLVFLTGTAVFTVSSAICAISEAQGTLIAARGVQGFGAAVISAAGLAIITSSFAEGTERNRALGFWAAIGGIGGSAGVLLGGVLTQAFEWPAVFLINLPVGLGLMILGRRLIAENRPADRERRFDLAGAMLISGGLTALVYGIARTDALGWGSPGVLLPIAGAFLLLGLFALVEGRVASDPLIPLSVFRTPVLRAANLIVFLLFFAVYSLWYFVSLFQQKVAGDDALLTGIAFLPMTITLSLAAAIAARIVARLGLRLALVLGMAVMTVGMLVLSTLGPTSSFAGVVLPGTMLAAIGAGLAVVPATIVAVRGVRPEQSGLASGVVNTSRLVGATIGVAVLSTLANSRTGELLAGGASRHQALADGYALSFLVAAGACALGGLAAAVLLPRRVEALAQAA